MLTICSRLALKLNLREFYSILLPIAIFLMQHFCLFRVFFLFVLFSIVPYSSFLLSFLGKNLSAKSTLDIATVLSFTVSRQTSSLAIHSFLTPDIHGLICYNAYSPHKGTSQNCHQLLTCHVDILYNCVAMAYFLYIIRALQSKK